MISLKQIEARTRNQKIRQLRGIWVTAYHLFDEHKCAAIRDIVDLQLQNLGAEPHGERQERERREWQEMPYTLDHARKTND